MGSSGSEAPARGARDREADETAGEGGLGEDPGDPAPGDPRADMPPPWKYTTTGAPGEGAANCKAASVEPTAGEAS